jgi:hypothetical protein
MRILKSEVRDMKEEDSTQPRRTEAVEGRVIPSEPRTDSEPAPHDQRHDA